MSKDKDKDKADSPKRSSVGPGVICLLPNSRWLYKIMKTVWSYVQVRLFVVSCNRSRELSREWRMMHNRPLYILRVFDARPLYMKKEFVILFENRKHSF